MAPTRRLAFWRDPLTKSGAEPEPERTRISLPPGSYRKVCSAHTPPTGKLLGAGGLTKRPGRSLTQIGSYKKWPHTGSGSPPSVSLTPLQKRHRLRGRAPASLDASSPICAKPPESPGGTKSPPSSPAPEPPRVARYVTSAMNDSLESTGQERQVPTTTTNIDTGWPRAQATRHRSLHYGHSKGAPQQGN